MVVDHEIAESFMMFTATGVPSLEVPYEKLWLMINPLIPTSLINFQISTEEWPGNRDVLPVWRLCLFLQGIRPHTSNLKLVTFRQ